MKKILVFVMGIVVGLSFNLFAQEEGADTSGNLKQERKEYIQQKKEENKQWREDFESRRQAAIDSYKAQGLSPEEINAKMADFRQEGKEHRSETHQEMKEQRQEFNQERKEMRMEKMDANADGQVDQTEKQVFRKERMDRNDDGSVDKTEKNQAREHREDVQERKEDRRERREDRQERREDRKDSRSQGSGGGRRK